MTTRLLHLSVLCSTALLLAACPGDDTGSDGTESAESGSADSTGTGGDCVPSDEEIPALDESACTLAANDYTPTVNGSADDVWPACVNDDGDYHPLEAPGAAARVEAWEMIRSIFAAGLTPEDFTAAREQYALDQGIESRTVRREDVHYPNIPEAEQDPGVDFDKQCTIEANVMNYPDRCAGPAKIAPIINEAFMAGQTGEGDPAVHAARIDAAIGWFMYLSVIKEATFSCPRAEKGADCDSSWAYYNGATGRANPLGFGGDVMDVSPMSNERVFDGIAAMKCFRDTQPADMDSDTSDPLYGYGYDQLDRANNHAAAVVLRDRLGRQLPLCGSEADANWAWVQTFGQGLIKPAQDADSGQAATLTALLENDAPTPADIQAGVVALDALFPCP
ncbi:hypothetical protein [Paraliomyxa miuraensis]|uniref:hypothetical protein n=1 Tax=Paraliomyxa miuraensis TaxID=376150 RepID=UPI0022512FAE|nr:hypothetical protein [Paraliomyxa miuraensis]MCX4246378.1 hypothetical protein [Paraliomyxa miuraensis]